MNDRLLEGIRYFTRGTQILSGMSIACGDGSHHTGIQSSLAGMAKQSTVGDAGIGQTQRHAEQIATVFHSPLNAFGDTLCPAIARRIQAFDAH